MELRSSTATSPPGLWCLNGYPLTADDADCVQAVAADDLTEDEFANWLRRHALVRPSPTNQTC